MLHAASSGFVLQKRRFFAAKNPHLIGGDGRGRLAKGQGLVTTSADYVSTAKADPGFSSDRAGGAQRYLNACAVHPVAPPPLRILMVDDDPLILKSLREVFEADKHIVATANGASRASIFFDRPKIKNVVITDLGVT
jgi:hypothetical protein